jgi:hypothetical protein
MTIRERAGCGSGRRGYDRMNRLEIGIFLRVHVFC